MYTSARMANLSLEVLNASKNLPLMVQDLAKVERPSTINSRFRSAARCGLDARTSSGRVSANVLSVETMRATRRATN